MRKLQVSYFSNTDFTVLPGVERKLTDTVWALSELGYEARLMNFCQDGRTKLSNYILAVCRSNDDILLFRWSFILFLLAPFLVIKRIQGKILLIDVPTPIITVWRELASRNLDWLSRILRRIFLLSSVFPLLLFNSIIQYSIDHRLINLMLGKKQKIIGNGIRIENYKIRDHYKSTHDGVDLVFVGSTAEWHGLDRLLNGLAEYYRSCAEGPPTVIRLKIIGAGDCTAKLQKQSASLRLEKYVKFIGTIKGKALDDEFTNMDVGIASLAIHRKNMTITSDLKSREYLARGLPIISSGIDLDIPDNLKFSLKVPADESIIDIQNVLSWYTRLKPTLQDIEVRGYADLHVSMLKKVEQIMNLTD